MIDSARPARASSRSVAWLSYAALVVFFGVCLVALWSDLAKMPVHAMRTALDVIALMGLLSLVNVALRTWRWQMLLRKLGHDLPLVFGSLAYIAGFAFTLAPGKVGELVRATYYKQRGISFLDVTAAFFVERTMDLAVIALLALVYLASGLSGGYGHVLVLAGFLFLVGLALLLAFGEQRLHVVAAYVQARSGRLGWVVAAVARGMASAKSLLTPGVVGAGLLLGVVAWAAEGLGLYALGVLAPGSDLGAGVAVGLYAMAILAGALTFLPGGLGTAEATMALLLVHRGAALQDALLVTLICRILTLWLAIGLGWLAVGLLRWMGLSRRPSAEASQVAG